MANENNGSHAQVPHRFAMIKPVPYRTAAPFLLPLHCALYRGQLSDPAPKAVEDWFSMTPGPVSIIKNVFMLDDVFPIGALFAVSDRLRDHLGRCVDAAFLPIVFDLCYYYAFTLHDTSFTNIDKYDDADESVRSYALQNRCASPATPYWLLTPRRLCDLSSSVGDRLSYVAEDAGAGVFRRGFSSSASALSRYGALFDMGLQLGEPAYGVIRSYLRELFVWHRMFDHHCG